MYKKSIFLFLLLEFSDWSSLASHLFAKEKQNFNPHSEEIPTRIYRYIYYEQRKNI